MFKTHFLQNKELVTVVIAAMIILIMVAVNGLVLVSSLTSIYLKQKSQPATTPIDIKTVTEAIKLLEK